ncbi:MAG: hypothetical protein GY756_22470 [bacterium]|nr:hypothetical protein [bacterium]
MNKWYYYVIAAVIALTVFISFSNNRKQFLIKQNKVAVNKKINNNIFHQSLAYKKNKVNKSKL